MAKAKDVLKRLVVLLDNGRVKEADVQAVLNGALINGMGVYCDGDIVRDGRRKPLNADAINSIAWPKADKPPAPKPPAPKPPATGGLKPKTEGSGL